MATANGETVTLDENGHSNFYDLLSRRGVPLF